MPDEGEVWYKGEPRRASSQSQRQARSLGIETIYQDLALADNLDIGANVFLGREPRKVAFSGLLPAIDRRQHAGRVAHEVLETLDIDIEPAQARLRPVRNALRRTAPGGRHRARHLLAGRSC